MDQSDPQTESDLTSEKSESACGESSKCTIAEMQTEQNTSVEKVNLPVEKEEATPNPEPSAVTNERGYDRLNGEADVPQQMSDADLQVSGDRPLQVEPEQERNFLIPGGFHQKLSPGYSTLPLPKKSCGSDGDQKSFSHLSSSKYGTVSYRKIRSGNTRQKIEEFEYMMMNLPSALAKGAFISGNTLSRYHLKLLHWSFFLSSICSVVVAVAVEEVLVLIQPDLCHPGQVTLHRLLPVFRELVRILSSEDVSHSRAGDDLDFPSTHPDLFKW
ncbi:hypothetical protein F7725_001934 [Dissostichus mawsoni]|uniref:Uncharacterized protein n=1 Tax=Dissostichus mawsoni TaxID=36200 RepID=A0A7J5Y106_DISMA|nr:hypothetical protein F7725_001934 [Dissostichus mawsoni]